MSARDAILGRIRRANGSGADREARVAARLAAPPDGIIPERGQGTPEERRDAFCHRVEAVAGSVARVATADDVPAAVADYLRRRNLPAALRMGSDRRLASLNWRDQPALDLRTGPSDGHDEVALSHAFAAIAETGTVALVSGTDNPTTLNFLPEHHIVVVDAADIAANLEAVLLRLRTTYGAGLLPRTVNLVTGPSRSGDIEQTIILGAHGPRALHVIVVG